MDFSINFCLSVHMYILAVRE